jgi:hypothetical protein
MEQLKNNGSKNTFRVPENYFEELTGRILDNTSEKGSFSRKITLSALKPYYTLAAVIAGAAIITLAILQVTTPDSRVRSGGNNEIIADVPQFLIDGMDMYIIESQLYEETHQEVEPTASDRELIIEYLMLNEVDMSLLYEYLDNKQHLN